MNSWIWILLLFCFCGSNHGDCGCIQNRCDDSPRDREARSRERRNERRNERGSERENDCGCAGSGSGSRGSSEGCRQTPPPMPRAPRPPYEDCGCDQ